MNKKIAIYCSGKASRVLKFYDQYSALKYQPVLVIYDGEISEIEKAIISKTKSQLFSFYNTEKLRGIKLSHKISHYILETLLSYNIEYLFCFGDKILKDPLISVFPNKIINFHPSILPSFPGLNAIDQALKTSVKVLGNTAHFIDKGIDTGPIICQTVISRQEYSEYEDVLSLQINMMKNIWDWINDNKIEIDKNNIVKISDKISPPFYI